MSSIFFVLISAVVLFFAGLGFFKSKNIVVRISCFFIGLALLVWLVWLGFMVFGVGPRLR